MVPFEHGLDLRGILAAAGRGDISAAFVVGGCAAMVRGDLGDWSEDGKEGEDPLSPLYGLELLVVQDHFLGPLARMAHVVLPRSTFAEKRGTFTNMERRVQLQRPVIATNGRRQSRPEWWSICQIAKRMNAPGFDFEDTAEVLDEIGRLVPAYAGISHGRLAAEGILVARPDPSNPLPIQVLYSDKEYRGLQWPCPSEAHAGTARLYEDGFPAERPWLEAPNFRASHQKVEGQLLFVPGRVLLQSEREIEVVKGRTNRIIREEWLEFSPADAAALDIAQGDTVEVKTSTRGLRGLAWVREEAAPGVVSSTGLFGQMAVELESSTEPDPMSTAPGLAIEPANLTKVPQV